MLIIDDEYKSRELVRLLLHSLFKDIRIVGAAGSVAEAAQIIDAEEPDLILLDVELGNDTGFDLLWQLKQIPFRIIFITAHSHYALQAIKFSAVDYLLKPLDPEDLKTAIEKVMEQQTVLNYNLQINTLLQNLQAGNQGRLKMALPATDGLIFVDSGNIIYCKAEGAYTSIHLEEHDKILVSKNLKEYELMLEMYRFFRVHHSYVINLNKIKKYVRGEGGYVIMSDGTSIDVSKRRKEAFLAAIVKS